MGVMILFIAFNTFGMLSFLFSIIPALTGLIIGIGIRAKNKI